MTRFEMQEHLVEVLGAEYAFDCVVHAMSDDQMEDLYKYICRCYEIEDKTEETEDFEDSENNRHFII